MMNEQNTETSNGRVLGYAGQLRAAALDVLPTRCEAASALLTGAMALLVEDFGEVAAVEMVQAILDETAARWRATLQ